MLQARLSTVLLLLAKAAALQPHAVQHRGALLLSKRRDCPVGFFSCVSEGDDFQDLCCADGWICTEDNASNPACCPSGAVCTGIVPEPTLSYVINEYFSFPYIQTSFSNPGVCSAAVSQCSSNFALCTVGLQGPEGYAVTIAVPGDGGTTVARASITLEPSSAQSVCSSLSSEACYGIQNSVCQQTGSVGVFTISSAPPRKLSFPLITIAASLAFVTARASF